MPADGVDYDGYLLLAVPADKKDNIYVDNVPISITWTDVPNSVPAHVTGSFQISKQSEAIEVQHLDGVTLFGAYIYARDRSATRACSVAYNAGSCINAISVVSYLIF